jgi:hypothetical protein
MIQVGDSCTIWDGEGPIVDPRSWPLGLVLRTKMKEGKKVYQVIWSDGSGEDQTWYSSSDITMDNLEGRF